MSITQERNGRVDRIPPHNLEAEMALIGSVLVDPEIMATIGPIVRASDFYAHVHESIFAVLSELHERRAPLDKWAVADALRVRDLLERVGGVSYLSSLMDTVQTAASASYYATLVHEKSLLRDLIHAGTQVSALGYEGEEDVDAALDRSSQLIMAIATRDIPQSVSAHDAALVVSREIINGVQFGKLTGFDQLDRIVSGLHPGRVYLLGARPGMGKTSVALAIARRIAQKDGSVLIASAEMSSRDLMQRLAAADASLDLRQFAAGELTSTEQERALRSLERLSGLPLWIDDQVGTVEQVVASARRHHVKSPLSLLVVDYVQLLGSESVSRQASANDRLTHISRRLKLLAKELNIPILVLSQLNRDVEGRNDKRPMLSDLRESGALEQDADVVIMLFREAVYNDDADPCEAWFYVRKNRYGPLGDARAHWVAMCARFQNPDEPVAPLGMV